MGTLVAGDFMAICALECVGPDELLLSPWCNNCSELLHYFVSKHNFFVTSFIQKRTCKLAFNLWYFHMVNGSLRQSLYSYPTPSSPAGKLYLAESLAIKSEEMFLLHDIKGFEGSFGWSALGYDPLLHESGSTRSGSNKSEVIVTIMSGL
jgi:hypothetical protein